MVMTRNRRPEWVMVFEDTFARTGSWFPNWFPEHGIMLIPDQQNREVMIFLFDDFLKSQPEMWIDCLTKQKEAP